MPTRQISPVTPKRMGMPATSITNVLDLLFVLLRQGRMATGCLLSIALAGLAQGENFEFDSQIGVAEMTYRRAVGEPAQAFVGGWKNVPPIRNVSRGQSAIVSDIASQLDEATFASACQKYERYGLGTIGHESNHAITERLSKSFGSGVWAFYCLDGRGAAFRDPPLRKSQVEALVPADLRGPGWKNYMTGKNEDFPMVILDEWVAFIASAKIDEETKGVSEHDAAYALEFAGYSSALLTAIDRFCPTYPDRKALADFAG